MNAGPASRLRTRRERKQSSPSGTRGTRPSQDSEEPLCSSPMYASNRFFAICSGSRVEVRAGGAHEGSRWEAQRTHRIQVEAGRAPAGRMSLSPGYMRPTGARTLSSGNRWVRLSRGSRLPTGYLHGPLRGRGRRGCASHSTEPDFRNRITGANGGNRASSTGPNARRNLFSTKDAHGMSSDSVLSVPSCKSYIGIRTEDSPPYRPRRGRARCPHRAAKAIEPITFRK